MQILRRGYDTLEMEFSTLEPVPISHPDEASGSIPSAQTAPAASEAIQKTIREVAALHDIPLPESDILLLEFSVL